MSNTGWQFWIDRGGTFTDVIGCAPDGVTHSLKLLSDNPQEYADAAAAGIARILEREGGPDRARVTEIRMGTTVATNALLERRGARTGLLLTRGFGDTLAIGDQTRPELFALDIHKPAPLYERVAEVDERISTAGEVLQPLNTAALDSVLQAWRAAGIESVAICLLHGWQWPAHEQEVAERARAAGFAHVCAAHAVSPTLELLSRAGTTLVDAYLSPVLGRYVDSLRAALRELHIAADTIVFMQSHGGLVAPEHFRGKDALLSGPAGGVVGMRAAGQRAGTSRLIGFDMGGTSTDVSVCAGEPDITTRSLIDGIWLRSPMLKIHTIAAGGGSLLRFADGRFQVGPASAGAVPGPLSYGRGGPLTITDANLLLGRLQAARFPRICGADGRQPLDSAGVQAAFATLAAEASGAGGSALTPERTAAGFLRVAVDNMANAIRQVTVGRGLDPREFDLCCFGGAGGQLVCQVADQLGIRRILLDPDAAVLSARGMAEAERTAYRQRSVDRPLDNTTLAAARELAAALLAECRDELALPGKPDPAARERIVLDVQAAGTATTLPIELLDDLDLQAEFARAHTAWFGFAPPGDATAARLHLAALRVTVTRPAAPRPAPATVAAATAAPVAAGAAAVYLDDEWTTLPVYERSTLQPEHTLAGPALIGETHSTLVLEQGWSLRVNASLQLQLERTAARAAAELATGPDPVLLEIVNNRFVYVAGQMGMTLAQTARSVNIRERRDFSCALFTADGELIANAPHVPVHLGSMDDSVRSALRCARAALQRGDVLLTNAPYNGGTHLPDVTVISGVVAPDTGALEFVVASRAHHADIGGLTPGSMPPFSRHIDEEGVLFDAFTVVADGRFRERELRAQLAATEWPARNPAQNVADFQAQIAANTVGRRLLLAMRDEFGAQRVADYARYVQDNAEACVRSAISKLQPGRFRYPLDNGQEIVVEIRLDAARRDAEIDFTGTSAARDNNLNAPVAVCQAAVMYVFRTLVEHPIPLNAGCRKPLRVIIPPGCMLNPDYPAAVVGGNVETSQCVTDALYGALGLLAGSQGTMNNLSFGNATHQYYETIAGGAGASRRAAGADAVQTHMTNTPITDVEILEAHYPVRVREFAVRRGSGGRGAHRGGHGVVRRIEFLQQLHAAVLSNNRVCAPFGLAGGLPGQPGRNRIERADGTCEDYGGALTTMLEPGDVLVIETPGGGGFGAPVESATRGSGEQQG
ncbi:MAG: hydantoinase B/oxoprolinase family protein [Gammaproteobacteria bacterium]|nr:hydantoinase B/oxoprolinase family protein [Gammaproteobacteria bacterium]